MSFYAMVCKIFLEYIDKLLRDFTREINIFINLFLMNNKKAKNH